MHLESWCNKHTKKMRTVKFNALKKQEGFITGTEKEQLDGIFHEWGMMELKNENGEIVGQQSCAIIEEQSSHAVYCVLPEDVTFDNPNPLKLIN